MHLHMHMNLHMHLNEFICFISNRKKVKKEVVDLFEDNEAGPSKPKKIKKEPVVAKERENNDANVSLTYQHDQVLYMYREELKALSMAELKLLLEFNGQLAPLNEAEVRIFPSYQ